MWRLGGVCRVASPRENSTRVGWVDENCPGNRFLAQEMVETKTTVYSPVSKPVFRIWFSHGNNLWAFCVKKKLLPVRFFREMFVSDVISVFLIFSDAFLPGNSVNKAEKVITTEYFS